MQLQIYPYRLHFKRPATTSRNTLLHKDTYLLRLRNEQGQEGWGEINLFKGLSADDRADFMPTLRHLQRHTSRLLPRFHQHLLHFPSIRFGLETALQDLQYAQPFLLFPTPFSQAEQPIPINGLVWMGNKDFMQQQIRQKIAAGFRCVKLKIGALDFDTEYAMLQAVRREFSAADMQLRVDANGAFGVEEALPKLERLSRLQLHSIEQPIAPQQPDAMQRLCRQSPLPIALDEELIGVHTPAHKQRLLNHIRPQYIILKPALLGGWQAAEEWIAAAQAVGAGWWVTSALESNVGLNAIAQWTAQLQATGYQGLGTGSLYTNNIASPLKVQGQGLLYSQEGEWQTLGKFESLRVKSL